MAYRITVAKSARREIESLPLVAAKRVIHKIEALAGGTKARGLQETKGAKSVVAGSSWRLSDCL